MKRFKTTKERLEAEHREKSDKKEDKILQREEEERQSGKKRTRKPKKPEPNPDDQNLTNATDPDSSLMNSGPCCIQGYNGQIIVNQDVLSLCPYGVIQQLITDCFSHLMKN